jgi:hypothetical protein
MVADETFKYLKSISVYGKFSDVYKNEKKIE